VFSLCKRGYTNLLKDKGTDAKMLIHLCFVGILLLSAALFLGVYVFSVNKIFARPFYKKAFDFGLKPLKYTYDKSSKLLKPIKRAVIGKSFVEELTDVVQSLSYVAGCILYLPLTLVGGIYTSISYGLAIIVILLLGGIFLFLLLKTMDASLAESLMSDISDKLDRIAAKSTPEVRVHTSGLTDSASAQSPTRVSATGGKEPAATHSGSGITQEPQDSVQTEEL